MRFYFTQEIGPKRRKTPEGYLVIEDVPIARTGMMPYGPGETPVSAGPDNVVMISREPEEVFRLETVASAAGKPIVLDHPLVQVTTINWKQLALGVMMNPHRGEGAMDDLLLADVVVMDPEGIEAIESGIREVSCGYDCDYDEVSPGRGRQRNIVINHLALVHRGRCGPRCAIGDRQTVETPMAKKTPRRSVWDRLRAAARDKNPDEMEKVIAEGEESLGDDDPDNPGSEEFGKGGGGGGGTGHHIEVHNHMPGGPAAAGDEPAATVPGAAPAAGAGGSVEERLGKLEAAVGSVIEAINKLVAGGAAPAGTGDEGNKELEGSLQMEAPPGTGDKAVKATDSAYLADSFQETASLAEVIAPGIRIPTFDRAASPKSSFDAICGMRRQALDFAFLHPETRGMIQDAAGNARFSVKDASCADVRTVFRAVGLARKAANARALVADVSMPRGGSGGKSKPKSLAELNERNRAKYQGA